jgi:glycosyltransferase involved in cell wall biosynthesis
MAVLEGMSHGLAIIATRVGAVPEAVREGSEGFLLEPGDVQTLAKCMSRLCSEQALMRQMGQQARKRAVSEFGMDAAADKLMAIYNQVLQSAADGRL